MGMNRWFLGDLAGKIAAVLLAVLVLLAVSAVVFRYVVGAPLAWAEEVEGLILLWIIMIGVVYGKRKNLLLRMDILLNMMPPAVQRWVLVFQEIVHCGIFVVMLIYGTRLAYQVGAKGTSILGIPQFWIYIALPVGATGLLVITLIQLYDLICGREAD